MVSQMLQDPSLQSTRIPCNLYQFFSCGGFQVVESCSQRMPWSIVAHPCSGKSDRARKKALSGRKPRNVGLMLTNIFQQLHGAGVLVERAATVPLGRNMSPNFQLTAISRDALPLKDKPPPFLARFAIFLKHQKTGHS